ncbi:hypothetical protein ASS64_09285 [Erythrobacter sp. AP23]|nr:hypothetical protein ASS64_09285 [Erythrobacter sp. AP23]
MSGLYGRADEWLRAAHIQMAIFSGLSYQFCKTGRIGYALLIVMPQMDMIAECGGTQFFPKGCG